MADTAQCETFFKRFDREAVVVAEPDGAFHRLFGLERGGVGQFLSPSVLGAGVRALLKGNLLGKPVGDVLMMPGAFLVVGHVVHWQFIASHVGDHPDLNEVALIARECATQ